MNKSTIKLEVGGNVYTGWKRAALDFDMESLSSSFSFSAYDQQGILGALTNGAQAVISIVNGNTEQLVIDGYIVSRDRSLANGGINVSITGSDKLVDLVECSVIRDSQTWVKKKFSLIVKDIAAPFGIQIDASELTSDPFIDKLTIQSGESAFDTIERLCRSQAVVPLSTFDGKLKLSYAATTHRADVDLVEGQNIKDCKEVTDWSERFSEYACISQASGGGRRWTKEMIQGRAIATDRTTGRYRPKLFVAESSLKQDALYKRVGWEAQVRAGRSKEYTVLVDGWFQKNQEGTLFSLWQKNKLVSLKAPMLDLDTELLISSVSMTLDDDGEQTVLSLRDKDTYRQDPTLKVELT